MSENQERFQDKIKERIKEIIDSGKYLLDRESACKMTLLALVADESIFLFGPPGTAKSMMAKWAASILDTKKYFSCLLNQYTQPDELFGPVSIQALGNGTREILTEGYMPDSEIAFLDEIWKAGPAILNTLLTICNEKTFRNGNKTLNVPLKLLISASNEFPSEDSGLEPLYDRFLIRLIVHPVSRKDSFVSLVTGKKHPEKNIEITAISKEELDNWRKGCEEIEVTKEITDFLYTLRLRLNEREIYVSDRRWKKIVNLLRTSAFLNGRSHIAYSDLFILENVLWSKLEERESVKECAIESVTTATVKSSFNFTERILSEIGKLTTFEVTDSESYDELVKMIDSQCTYLDSLKQNLEVARSGGEDFWKNIFAGLNTDFELEMMNKGIEKLREFISDVESGLDSIRFSKQPNVKQTLSSFVKNGVAPTVILERKENVLHPAQSLQTEIHKNDEFVDIDEITQLSSELQSNIPVVNHHTQNIEIELPEQQLQQLEIQNENTTTETIQEEIVNSNKSSNEEGSTENTPLETIKNQTNKIKEELSNKVVSQEQIENKTNENNTVLDSTPSQNEEYLMLLSNIKNFDDFISISNFPYTGDSSDNRYKWNGNVNNGSKWWNLGGRFYQLLNGDRNILSTIEAECAKKDVGASGKYHWVFSVCYIFEKNDGLYDWKTKAELEWLLGTAYHFVESVFEKEFN